MKIIEDERVGTPSLLEYNYSSSQENAETKRIINGLSVIVPRKVSNTNDQLFRELEGF
jgi:hypothetical protein